MRLVMTNHFPFLVSAFLDLLAEDRGSLVIHQASHLPLHYVCHHVSVVMFRQENMCYVDIPFLQQKKKQRVKEEDF